MGLWVTPTSMLVFSKFSTMNVTSAIKKLHYRKTGIDTTWKPESHAMLWIRPQWSISDQTRIYDTFLQSAENSGKWERVSGEQSPFKNYTSPLLSGCLFGAGAQEMGNIQTCNLEVHPTFPLGASGLELLLCLHSYKQRSHLASFFSSLLMSWLKGFSFWARTRKSLAFWYSVMRTHACQRTEFQSLSWKDSIFAAQVITTTFLSHLFLGPCPPTHLSTPEEGLGILAVNGQSLLSIAQSHGGSLQLQIG